MGLLSEDILPLKEREGASKEKLLECYLQLEHALVVALNDESAELYRVFTKQLRSICEQVDSLKIDIEEKESPGLDVYIRMLERVKPIFEGLAHVREKSKWSRLLTEKENSSVIKHVKN